MARTIRFDEDAQNDQAYEMGVQDGRKGAHISRFWAKFVAYNIGYRDGEAIEQFNDVPSQE